MYRCFKVHCGRGASAVFVVAALLGGVSARAADSTPTHLAGDPEAEGFADLFFSNALLKLEAQDLPAALADLDRAAATVPKDGTFQYFRGLVLLRLGRTEDAIKALQSAVPPASSRVPEARVRAELGGALLTKGDLPAATEQLQQAVTLEPQNGRAQFMYGICLLRGGKIDEALQTIDRATSLDASLDPAGLFFKGVAAYRAGQLDEAKQLFQQAQSASADQAATINSWLATIEAAAKFTKPPVADLRVSLGYEWDDNPAFLTNDLLDLNEFIGVDSEDTRATLQLRGSWLPVRDRSGYTLQFTLQAAANQHADFEALDSSGVGLFMGLAHGGTPLGFIAGPSGYVRVPTRDGGWGWVLQAGANRFDLDSEKFRSDAEGSLSFFFNAASIGTTQLDLGWVDRSFDPVIIETLSGNIARVRLGQVIYLGNNPARFVRVVGSWADHAVDDEQFDRTERQIAAEFALPVGRRWSFFLSGARTRTHFDELSSGIERTDNRLDLRGSVTFALTKWLYLSARYGTTEIRVEPDLLATNFDLDRKVGSLNLTAHW